MEHSSWRLRRKLLAVMLAVILAGSLCGCNVQGGGDKVDITENLAPLRDFVLVGLGSQSIRQMTYEIKDRIAKICGGNPQVVFSEEKAKDAKYILVAGRSRHRDSLEEYSYGEAEIFWEGNKLVIGATSDAGVDMAVSWLLNESLVEDGDGTAGFPFSEEGKTLWSSGTWPEREEYLEDPAKMPLFWQYEWEPRREKVSFEDRLADLNGQGEGIFTIAHRGDWDFYPENSLECIISAWAMGADCVEVDIRYTRDGVAVLMHDEMLTRTTDVNDKKGKDGLPDSKRISDWTYGELCQLNLVKNGETTPFKIPTYEEALRVSKGRLFLFADKGEEWRYSQVQSLGEREGAAAQRFLLDDMLAAGNASSQIVGHGAGKEVLKIQKELHEKTGQDIYVLPSIRDADQDPEWLQTFLTDSLTNTSCFVGPQLYEFDDGWRERVRELCRSYPDLTVGVHSGLTEDDEQTWQEACDLGVRILVSYEDILRLVKFEAALQGFVEETD